MAKKCYEIKNCPFYKNEANMKSSCPVFDLKISCWEYDWINFYDKMPKSKEKEEWRCGMIEHCQNCDIYHDHKDEMDKKLLPLRR